MASIIGNVPRFDFDVNSWKVFYQQLMQFCIANSITDDQKKKAILLTSLSEKSYILLQNLVNPLKLDEVSTTFEACIQVMENHFKPASSAFAERYKFYNASKLSTETVNEWAARVRALAVNCDFDVFLETAIRDKFVMGLEKCPARDKIFLENVTCTMSKAIEIANTAEYIRKQGDSFNVKQEESEACYFVGNNSKVKAAQNKGRNQNSYLQQQCQRQANQQVRQQQMCTVCGIFGHSSNNCKYKTYKCNNCKKRGHLKKMCHAKPIECNYVDNKEINMFSVRSESDSPIKVKVVLNKTPIVFELNTGSQYSVLSLNCYKHYFSSLPLRKTNLILRTYNGMPISPVGICDMCAEYKGKRETLSVIVVLNGGPPLLGRNFLKVFKIDVSNFNYAECEMHTGERNIFNKFKSLFDGKLGCFNKSQAKLYLKEGAVPKFFKPRVVPLAIQSKVEQEIEKLIKLKVLEPVKFSE